MILNSIKYIITIIFLFVGIVYIFSGNRILKDLIQLEAIEFKKDKKDTRLKHVYLSDKGLKLFEEVFSMQKKRIYKALLNSNSKEVLNFNNVLKKIINE